MRFGVCVSVEFLFWFVLTLVFVGRLCDLIRLIIVLIYCLVCFILLLTWTLYLLVSCDLIWWVCFTCGFWFLIIALLLLLLLFDCVVLICFYIYCCLLVFCVGCVYFLLATLGWFGLVLVCIFGWLMFVLLFCLWVLMVWFVSWLFGLIWWLIWIAFACGCLG